MCVGVCVWTHNVCASVSSIKRDNTCSLAYEWHMANAEWNRVGRKGAVLVPESVGSPSGGNPLAASHVTYVTYLISSSMSSLSSSLRCFVCSSSCRA